MELRSLFRLSKAANKARLRYGIGVKYRRNGMTQSLDLETLHRLVLAVVLEATRTAHPDHPTLHFSGHQAPCMTMASYIYVSIDAGAVEPCLPHLAMQRMELRGTDVIMGAVEKSGTAIRPTQLHNGLPFLIQATGRLDVFQRVTMARPCVVIAPDYEQRIDAFDEPICELPALCCTCL